MEYLVMECHPAYAVLLDEEGRFVKAANLHYVVGQRVTEVILMEESPRVSKPKTAERFVRGAVGAFAACLCLFLLGFGLFFRTAHATVELYLGPAASLEVDREGQVVSLSPLNAEGAALLEGYEGMGKSAQIVCRELMDEAVAEGYAPPQEGYSLSVSSEAGWTRQLESRLWQQLAAYGDATLLVLPVPGSGEK